MPQGLVHGLAKRMAGKWHLSTETSSLQILGGTPGLIAPDNLRTAAKKPPIRQTLQNFGSPSGHPGPCSRYGIRFTCCGGAAVDWDRSGGTGCQFFQYFA